VFPNTELYPLISLKPRPPSQSTLGPGGLALIYVATGVAWILLSDYAFTTVSMENINERQYQIGKGLLFVFVTGTLLYLLVRWDVRALREYQASLAAAKEKAEEMNRVRSTILANMSHELRTPLTSIIGFAEILKDESEAQHQEFASMIQDSGLRLMDTLNSLLDIAQLDSNNFTVRRATLNLEEEVSEVVRIYQHRADDRGIALEIETSFGPPVTLSLDKVILARILSNLISNAIKFTYTGRVTIRLGRTETHATIRVEDTGIGIGEAFTPYLFSEFQQESSGLSRQFEGTGLGLAVTQRLVEAMQGDITVESKKGEGSAFTVRFPLQPE
jgi:signal transduction histidine kinase